MDDLLGEDWQKPAKTNASSSNPPLSQNPFAANFNSLRASPAIPTSGTASPQNLSRPSSTLNGSAKAAGGDAFGNLLSNKSQKAAGSNVSIQERQRQLIEEKRRQQEQQASMWDTLGSGRGTPEIRGPSPVASQGPREQAEDDIMAAFNKDAPVSKASHFPPPLSTHASGRSTPAFQQTSIPTSTNNDSFNDDDDPFGLSALPNRSNGHVPVSSTNGDDDDILGDLGKPVAERPAKTQAVRPAPQQEQSPVGADEPQDRALAELVDMGFPIDNAKIALAESGGDPQAAVGCLLQQAHQESKRKARDEADERRPSPSNASRSPHRRPQEVEAVPAWMRQEPRPSSAARRQDSRSPAGGEKDAAQMAQEYGTKFLKGASSLWKASQKQMAKTVAEFQQDRDPGQPKWMQEAASESRPSSQQRQRARDAKPNVLPTPSSMPVRPKAPPRTIPSVSPAALSTSANHRKAGGEAFKRGDYASAHEAYGAALSPLPATHPITIIVLSNRSLTALKTGDAKMAVSDADRALELIGASQGVGETIDLGGGEGTKDMRDFYGKALMRKAEALEHMEKWTDAAGVWKIAIASGVGGAVSLRGRDRCEKAAAPKPAAKPATPRPAPAAASRAPPAKNLGNSLQRPALSTVKSAEAVKKLRAANAAAEKADDEKFALSDQVEAKLVAWKGGKSDNLRALLQSLDAVLWESAGWKKVGMSDLVLPNKVKIIYMKAIAKVHPDKIAQDATTEQRMISAAVFSTLNEAWDKFKKDNNL
ncbi:uncharacterized protein MYCFIDRAFT_154947 [Pseudocercospora fijiensis CIRAD86]|uniref:UBA domain-containing protein n=1 Tax=Pseudocercospora fijiensis (strain CIRAD86) TaxID=383855 RepID=M3AZ25_PSEFD|nr:uncharacterized protein MYCFIDRAFT_154947 [Pseudocercospora fijiensis CIRAD86]EME82438.1 hypothetical protein MYCFIDRAFT_154947 [Pseudocercospora fijiensis CIRAD86]